MLTSPFISQSSPIGFTLSSVAAANDNLIGPSSPRGSPISPAALSGGSGGGSSYSTAYTVKSVNSVKSRKNVLYPRRDRLRESLVASSSRVHASYDETPSAAVDTLVDLEKWRLSSARPGSPERSGGTSLGECIARTLEAIRRGSGVGRRSVKPSLEEAGNILGQMYEADEIRSNDSDRRLLKCCADTLLAVHNVVSVSDESGLQLIEGPCTALANALKKASGYLRHPDSKPPCPGQINATDARLFQEYIVSASCNASLCSVLEKTTVALRTIDMTKASDLPSNPPEIDQTNGSGRTDREHESRGRSRTITQETFTMSLPSQAQKDARQALQRLRTSQAEELENDLARLRFFIWRIVNPAAKDELHSIMSEVLPHHHV